MSSSEPVKIDITINESQFEEGAKSIFKKIRPNWNLDVLQFKIFTDGITNKLLGCYLPTNTDDVVLVRINGENTEAIINRVEEQETFRALSKAGRAPPVYAVFNNGMAYGFFPGIPLDEETVRLPKIQRLIAEEMVRLHKVNKSTGKIVPTHSEYECRLSGYLDATPTKFEDQEKQKQFVRDIPSKEELRQELKEIVKELDALNMKAVFSHNDLLLKNIIYDEDKNEVHFIDYEYAFYNYEAFDIGNHFCEYAGMGDCNYDLYPSKDEQLPWLRNYLTYKSNVEGGSEDVSDEDLESLYIQVNKCACAAHFLWTVWALIQAASSTIDFDYLSYAKTRLTEYYRSKKEFFPL